MQVILVTGHSQAALESIEAVLSGAGGSIATMPHRSQGDKPVEASIELNATGDSDDVATAMTGAGEWLAADAHHGVVLVYVDPFVAAQRAVELSEASSDAPLQAALRNWCAEARDILRLLGDHPDRCILVHEDSALGRPAELAAYCGLALLGESSGADEPTHSTKTAVDRVVASCVARSDRELSLLQDELASVAHMPGNAVRVTRKAALEAWWTYLLQVDALDRLGSEIAVKDAMISTAQSEVRRYAGAEEAANVRLALETKALSAGRALLNSLTQERDEQSRMLAEFRETKERLQHGVKQILVDLHGAHQEVEMSSQRLAEEKLLHAAERAAVTAKTGEIELLARELQSLRNASAELHGTVGQLRLAGGALRTERDSSRLQVMQLNAQIDTLLADAQKERMLRDQLAKRMEQWRRLQPTTVEIDLRDAVDGENWYEAETDGRWTGPDVSSTLRLPPLRAAKYDVAIAVVGSMSLEIADGVLLSIDGQSIPLNHKGKKHPLVLTGTFVASGAHTLWAWDLTLTVPHTRSPSESGSQDRRRLGLRIRSITLTRVS